MNDNDDLLQVACGVEVPAQGSRPYWLMMVGNMNSKKGAHGNIGHNLQHPSTESHQHPKQQPNAVPLERPFDTLPT